MTDKKLPPEYWAIELEVADAIKWGALHHLATVEQAEEYLIGTLAGLIDHYNWKDEQAVWDGRCSDQEFEKRKAKRDAEMQTLKANLKVWADLRRQGVTADV